VVGVGGGAGSASGATLGGGVGKVRGIGEPGGTSVAGLTIWASVGAAPNAKPAIANEITAKRIAVITVTPRELRTNDQRYELYYIETYRVGRRNQVILQR
jgi:hypothetical protein